MATFEVSAKFDGSNWTEITGFVRRIRVKRGRRDDLDVAEAGSLIVELDNSDGRFSPENTSGAYSPNVKPGVEVRVRVTVGSTVSLFVGIAVAWSPMWVPAPQSAAGNNGATVRLEAVDGFEQLRTFDIPSASSAFIRDNDPDAYWPLGDSGNTQRDYSGNGRDAEIQLGTAGASSLVTGGAGAVQTVYDGGENRGRGVIHLRPPQGWWGGGSDVTFSMWLSVDELVGASFTFHPFIVSAPALATDQLQFLIASDQLALIIFEDGTSETVADSSGALTWTEGTDYQVGFYWDQTAQEVTFYRNGVALGTEATTLTPNFHANGWASVGNPGGVSGDTVTFCEAAIWPSDQSALMSDLHDAGDGFASDTPNERITRVLDWAGWASAARDLDDGTTPLAGIPGDQSALKEAQDAAAADGGLFYISSDGNAVFQGRRERWESESTVQHTFDEQDVNYQTIEWEFDTTYLHNRVLINSNTQGTSDGVAQSSTSISDFGERELTVNTVSNNSADNRERAVWEVARRRQPKLRPSSIELRAGSTSQQDVSSSLELQDFITTVRRPGSGQDVVSVNGRVAEIRHDITEAGKLWEMRARVTEADTDRPAIYDSTSFSYDQTSTSTGSDFATYYGY